VREKGGGGWKREGRKKGGGGGEKGGSISDIRYELVLYCRRGETSVIRGRVAGCE
jgi:hypothetical protein